MQKATTPPSRKVAYHDEVCVAYKSLLTLPLSYNVIAEYLHENSYFSMLLSIVQSELIPNVMIFF